MTPTIPPRMGGPPFVVLLLLSALAAGCVGDDASPSAPTVAQPDDTAVVGHDEAGIEGAVVDETLLPIANATVVLENGTRQGGALAEVVTGSAGAFSFYGLAAGNYRLVVTAEGYERTATLVQVRAAHIEQVQVVLGETASAVPYVDLFIGVGHQPCGISIVITSGNCMDGATITFHFPIAEGHRLTMTETTWEDSTIAMDVTYTVKLSEDDEGVFIGGSIEPHPPIRHLLYPEAEPFGRDALDDEPRLIPDTNTSFILETYGFYDGHYQDVTNATLYPVCALFLGYCTGAGVDFDFRYTIYATAFINEAPGDPTTYTAIPDA